VLVWNLVQPPLSNDWTGINSDQIGLNEEKKTGPKCPWLGLQELKDKMTKKTNGQKIKEQRKDD